MKFNRKEYDLIYDAFQYMEFKMSKDQKRLAEQILDSAFYPDTETEKDHAHLLSCLLYTSPSPRDKRQSRMPSSA
mgnify:CR=1 FL=1